MRRVLIYVGMLLGLMSQTRFGYAQTLHPILLSPATKEISLQQQAWIIDDIHKTLKINDIQYLLKNNQFRLFEQSQINAQTTESSVWVIFKVKQTENSAFNHWFLHLNKNHISYIDLFYYQNGQIKKIETGNYRVSTIKKYKKLHYYLPLALTRDTETTFYLKLKSSINLNLNLSICKDDYVFAQNTGMLYWYGIFSGLLLASILVSIVIFISIRRKGYLYFAAYTFMAWCFFLFSSGFYAIIIGEELGQNLRLYYVISYMLMVALAMVYANQFLNLKRNNRLIYQISLLEIGLSIGVILIYPFIPFKIAKVLLDTNALSMLCLGTIASYQVYQKGNKAAFYYMIGYTCYFLGGMLDLLQGYSIINANIITENGGEIGIILESFFLLMGLMIKYQHEKKVYYAKIKKAQRDKLKVQVEATTMLEQKVQERTNLLNETVDALFQKNELLIKHQEEIIKQRDLLDEKNKSLDELNMTKNKFFSILSHDIRTPLNSLLGFSELIGNGIKSDDKETILHIAQKLNESSKNVLELIDNILQWALSQTKGLELHPEHFYIHELIEKNIQLLAPMAENKNINLEVYSSATLGVYADRNTIHTVLRNLISNAIKFSFSGQKICIKVKENQDFIYISITDKGIGMSANQSEKLFRIDQKQSTQGTQQEKGTGLGLILCKEFVELNGGKIGVESTEMQGSTFSFCVPKSNQVNEKIQKDNQVLGNFKYN